MKDFETSPAVPVEPAIGKQGPHAGEFTPGPWVFRVYASDEADIANIRAVGLEPVRLLSNDGQATVMTGGDDCKPIARVECQTEFKRGQGYRTDCAERDANARLIAAAPELLEAAIIGLGYMQVAIANVAVMCPDDQKVKDAIRQKEKVIAAIAKATGTP